MKHKFLITALATVSLLGAGTVSTLSHPQTVEASSNKIKLFSKYAKDFHRVVITERTQVYKVHRGKDEAHNRYTKAYVLKPGDTATIRDRGIAWGWTIGKSYNYCSMRDSFSFNWFDTYSKKVYIDKGLFTGSSKRVGKAYTFTWKQYCHLCKLGIWSKDVNDKKAWNRINKYVKSIHAPLS